MPAYNSYVEAVNFRTHHLLLEPLGTMIICFFFPVTIATDFLCHLPEWKNQLGHIVFSFIFHIACREKSGIRIYRVCSSVAALAAWDQVTTHPSGSSSSYLERQEAGLGVPGFSGSRLSSLDFFGRTYMCACMMSAEVQWFLEMTAEGER